MVFVLCNQYLLPEMKGLKVLPARKHHYGWVRISLRESGGERERLIKKKEKILKERKIEKSCKNKKKRNEEEMEDREKEK